MAYPLNHNDYLILQQINIGISTIVYKATCSNLKLVVAIKAFNGEITDKKKEDIDLCSWTIDYLSHTNLLKPHCSFRVDNKIWVVMPFMSYGSIQSNISSSSPKGLPKTNISIILKETLRFLSNLHSEGVVHHDIKAGNIFFDSNGSLKVAYFGEFGANYQEISSYSMSSLSSVNDLNGMPYWMSPEVIHSTVEDRFMSYDIMLDIWILGITAFEVVHGCPVLSHRTPSQALGMRILNHLSLAYHEDNGSTGKVFSQAFKDLVSSFLAQDPLKRLTAEALLDHHFFKNSKPSDFLIQHMLLCSVRDIEKMARSSGASIEGDDENKDDNGTTLHAETRRINWWNFNEDLLLLEPIFATDSDDENANHQDDEHDETPPPAKSRHID